jgi:hypothetical protein
MPALATKETLTPKARKPTTVKATTLKVATKETVEEKSAREKRELTTMINNGFEMSNKRREDTALYATLRKDFRALVVKYKKTFDAIKGEFEGKIAQWINRVLKDKVVTDPKTKLVNVAKANLSGMLDVMLDGGDNEKAVLARLVELGYTLKAPASRDLHTEKARTER